MEFFNNPNIVNMKTKISIVSCLFLSLFTQAQNPFVTKADVITEFAASPNGEWAGCSWWGADSNSKIKLLKPGTHEITDIESVDLKKGGSIPFKGVAFLSNDQLIYSKAKAVYTYQLKNRESSKLFDLPDFGSMYLTPASNGQMIYFVVNQTLFGVNVANGERKSEPLGNAPVIGVSAIGNKGVIYTMSKSEGGKMKAQVWEWDGKNKPVDVTFQFSTTIEDPYLVEATIDPHLFVVAGKSGLYRFDRTAQKATKLADQTDVDPIVEIQVSGDGKTVYYKTNNQKKLINTVSMDGVAGKMMIFQKELKIMKNN